MGRGKTGGGTSTSDVIERLGEVVDLGDDDTPYALSNDDRFKAITNKDGTGDIDVTLPASGITPAEFTFIVEATQNFNLKPDNGAIIYGGETEVVDGSSSEFYQASTQKALIKLRLTRDGVYVVSSVLGTWAITT